MLTKRNMLDILPISGVAISGAERTTQRSADR
jgi:hypothetical protein